MELTRIDRDCNAVRVLAAQARGERVDSGVRENLDNLTKDLASDFNPQNRHIIAQLVGFAVNEMTRPQMNLMQVIGDAKQVPLGAKAAFKVQTEGVQAFIQAKGSTTPRSKVASKQVTLDTVSISARPVLNVVELQTG